MTDRCAVCGRRTVTGSEGDRCWRAVLAEDPKADLHNRLDCERAGRLRAEAERDALAAKLYWTHGEGRVYITATGAAALAHAGLSGPEGEGEWIFSAHDVGAVVDALGDARERTAQAERELDEAQARAEDARLRLAVAVDLSPDLTNPLSHVVDVVVEHLAGYRKMRAQVAGLYALVRRVERLDAALAIAEDHLPAYALRRVRAAMGGEP